MALVRSVIRRASRKGRGFATPWGGMAERRPRRVAMQGRRAGRHALLSSLLNDEVESIRENLHFNVACTEYFTISFNRPVPGHGNGDP